MAQQIQQELLTLVRPYLNSSLTEELDCFVRHIYSYDNTRKAMREMNLDAEKLPLGTLKIERVRKSLEMLWKIQKSLQGGGTLTTAVEQKIQEATSDFYQILPYDFGAKKPQSIYHILRVKERVKQMDLLADIYLWESTLVKSAFDLRSGDVAQVLKNELLCNIKPLELG